MGPSGFEIPFEAKRFKVRVENLYGIGRRLGSKIRVPYISLSPT